MATKKRQGRKTAMRVPKDDKLTLDAALDSLVRAGIEIEAVPKETEHSPAGMKKVGMEVAFATNNAQGSLHFPLGCRWRWFHSEGIHALQVLDSEGKIVAEVMSNYIVFVTGPTWTQPKQRSAERP